MKTIAFFGHRKILNATTIHKRLKNTLNEFISQGFSNLLIGCHGDFDALALETCIDHKKNVDKSIKINVVLTSLGVLNKDKYGYDKTDIFKNKFFDTIFYDIEETHFKNRITVSNKKMIDDSDLIICYIDMKAAKSGAKKAVDYAIKQNKKVVNLFQQDIDKNISF